MEQGISAGDSAQAAIQADFRRPCLTYNQLSPMSYQVLARKYRPQKFSEVIGQEHVTRTLKNAIEQGRTAHGYIFSGHRGIGKTTVARILAMALNCRSSDKPVAEPCGVCDSCTEIRAGNAVDVIEIDAATNRGIDEIRELREAARYRPARDRFKIYILDEAHQITDAAFNALLKTLEEPPGHVVFMLATTQPEDIPQTIRSRCQHFSFRAVRLADKLISEGQNPTHFARQLVRFLRNAVVAKVAGKDSALLQISSDERARVARIADLFSEEDLARHLQIMLRTHGELGYKQEQRFHLELGLLKMAHAQRLLPIEQLLTEVAGAAGTTGPRPASRPSVISEARASSAAPARGNFVSPFAADSARKSSSKSELSAESGPTAGPRNLANMGAPAPVIMGSAVPEHEDRPGAAVALRESAPEVTPPSVDRVRNAVLNALGE